MVTIDHLETPRLVARRLTRADIECWLPFMTSPGALRFFATMDANRAGAEAWIERQLQRYQRDGHGLMALIDKASGALVGQCGLMWQQVDGVAELEVGYHLLPRYRGRGYGLEAARAFRDYAFASGMSESLVSLIHINNHDSQRLAGRNGLAPERLTLNYGVFAGVPHYVYRIGRERWLQLQRPPLADLPLVVSDDRGRLDRRLIHRFLTDESYWAKGISEATVNRAIDHSLCFGGYQGNHQRAFARVVTDFATFAYLADVFVVAEARGRGYARQMMAAIMADPRLQGLRRFSLATRDCHRLYAGFGFNPPARPDTLMERFCPTIYQPPGA